MTLLPCRFVVPGDDIAVVMQSASGRKTVVVMVVAACACAFLLCPLSEILREALVALGNESIESGAVNRDCKSAALLNIKRRIRNRAY